MAGYAHKVARVTLFGSSFGGAEEWSTGFFMGAPGADAIAGNAEFSTVLRNAWQVFFTEFNSGVGNLWKTDGVKIALMGTDGKTELDSVITDYYPVPVTGGYSSNYPPQISLVATLMSGIGKGLGGKGRMYLPGISYPVDSSGHLSSQAAGFISTGLKTFFDTLNGSFDHPGFLINASQGRGDVLAQGKVNRIVDTVRVGNVFDTQRRRRNQLSEQYVAVNITE